MTPTIPPSIRLQGARFSHVDLTGHKLTNVFFEEHPHQLRNFGRLFQEKRVHGVLQDCDLEVATTDLANVSVEIFLITILFRNQRPSRSAIEFDWPIFESLPREQE
jgi:hypothetical protein